MEIFLQSPRLILRKLTKVDLPVLRSILQDPLVMYAWEHAFTDEQISQWIDKNLQRYASDGFSYMVASHKESGQLVGLIGLLMEDVDDSKQVGIAYILKRDQWGKGYATEGARTCLEYAFRQLHASKVVALIRPNNLPSRAVAERLGMEIEGEIVRYYRGQNMPHLVYSVTK